MKKLFFSFLIFNFFAAISSQSFAQEDTDVFELDLTQLASLKVVSASRYEQSLYDAPANITVITPKLIERRGYRNLIEVLEDVPGFDFATFEDGGGEYPVHSLSRGIGGDNGNTKILFMVDNIIQNHISFNWSLGWNNQMPLHDIERIEIIQGPGSALYGSNALSGIIHIITKKKQEKDNEIYVKPWIGQHDTKAIDLRYASTFKDLHYSATFRKYDTDGDQGIGRPDPGSYFQNNFEPNVLTQNYNSSGVFETNVANPTAGRALEDGFNNSKDNLGLRANLFYFNPDEEITSGTKEAGIGFSYWDKEDGLGSYVPGFEYRTRDPEYLVHYRNYHIYGKHDYQFKENLLAKSLIWYRANTQEPNTGFTYAYRFNDLKKSYYSSSYQLGLEEQAHFSFGESSKLLIGGRYLNNRKMDQLISLGQIHSGNTNTTTSSWELADQGLGIGLPETEPDIIENEYALYGVLDGDVNRYVSYSLGTRFDYSTEYKSTINPRAALILNLPVEDWKVPVDQWNVKLLGGSAFRAPSIFETRDEFRGNTGLEPEKIITYEIENNIQVFSNRDRDYFSDLHLKFNFFLSELKDFISLVPDASRAGGERYDNIGKSYIRGVSTRLDLNVMKDLFFYFNYIFLEARDEGGRWDDIEHTAKHKINAGFNWLTLQQHLNINFRLNYVGERKVPITNSFFNDLAPGYTKANLVLTGKSLLKDRLWNIEAEPQLIVKNLFDEDIVGVGRQAGSSDRSAFDPDTNPNPAGFIPPYHPQPGRTWFFNVKFTY